NVAIGDHFKRKRNMLNRKRARGLAAVLFLASCAGAAQAAPTPVPAPPAPSPADAAATQAEPPTSWIDPDTGHRIVRLSREPGTASLYFNQNAYTADGQRIIVTSPSGISTINLKTGAIDLVAPGKVRVIVAGRKTGDVYFTQDGVLYAANVTTHAK